MTAADDKAEKEKVGRCFWGGTEVLVAINLSMGRSLKLYMACR